MDVDHRDVRGAWRFAGLKNREDAGDVTELNLFDWLERVEAAGAA